MPTDLIFIIAASWSALAFAGYYFLSNNISIADRIRIFSSTLDGQGNRVLLQRSLGVLFLGIMSSLIILLSPGITPGEFGLSFSFLAAPPWWTFLAIPLILFTGYFASKQDCNLALYPQIRSQTWTREMIVISAVSWILFLVAYEFLFRGFLFYSSLGVMETGPAIALNVAVYALVHIYKGPRETFGAIPVGVLLCYMTLITGNIWSAVILHSVMALSNEWFSLCFHPDMKLIKAS